jgi:hypothetical protein
MKILVTLLLGILVLTSCGTQGQNKSDNPNINKKYPNPDKIKN